MVCQTSTGLCGSFEIGLSNFYKLSTGFGALQTGLPNLYRASAGIYVIETSLQQLRTFNMVWGSHPQTFNRLCDSPNMYHNMLNAFVMLWSSQNWFAEALQDINRHFGSQNKHENPLQAFSYLAGREHVPREHLLAFNMFYGSQNWGSEQKLALGLLSNCFVQLLQAVNRSCCTSNWLA